MRFQNPQFAPFLLLVLVPILLHLRSRRTLRIVTLPTFRFVQQAAIEQAKLRRIRQKWLLLLRIGIVAALVGVFLKPVLVAPMAQTVGTKRVVVMVLDASLSMQTATSGVSAFARAKGQCENLLDSLQVGDRANLIFARSTAQAVLSRPGSETLPLRQAFDKTPPSLERGDMAAAMRLAKEQLENMRSGQKEIWLFSDFQRTNWANVNPDDFPKEVRIVANHVQTAPVGNSAITELRLNPPTPRAGEPAEVIATIWNDSDAPRAFPVTLHGSELSLEQTLNSPAIAPHASGTVTFPVNFPETRSYRLSAGLPNDALTADNTRFLAADLRQSLTVILLSDAVQNPRSAAYFLARALNPDPKSSGGVRVISKTAQTLSETDLQTCDALILAEVQTLPSDKTAMLTRYIINGGNMIGFLINEASAGLYTALNKGLLPNERLPFLPLNRLDVGGRGKGAITFSEARFRSPLLQLFRDVSAADLGKAQFRRFFLTETPDAKTEVLIKYEDGTAAVARRAVGAGNVLLCNFSPSPSDSDFAKMPEFPLLVHELLNGLTGENRERRDFVPGGSAWVNNEAAQRESGQVRVQSPSGKEEAATVEKAGGILIDRVEEIGFHSVTLNGNEAAVFAVNPHADESDLRPTDTRQWQNTPNSAKVIAVNENQTPDELQQERPLWQWLLLGVLGLLIVEQFLLAPRRKQVQ